MRGVDTPLERGFAEPGLDVLELGVGPTRMIADDVQPEDTENFQRGHAASGEFEQRLDEITDRRLAEALKTGRTELKRRLTGAEDTGEQRRMDLRRGREDQDVALAQAGHRRVGERGEDLITDDLGFAPGPVATMQGERRIRGSKGSRRSVEGINAGMETAQQRIRSGATTRR